MYNLSFIILIFYFIFTFTFLIVYTIVNSKENYIDLNISNKTIPKIIHKCIITDSKSIQVTDLPQDIQNAIKSFEILNPNYKINIYNHDSCIEYINKNYSNPIILKTFNKFTPYSYKVDFFKFLVLYKTGGFYSDIKQVCLNSFDKIFPKNIHSFYALDLPTKGVIENSVAMSFMATAPYDKRILNAINTICENAKREYYGTNPLDPTGPRLFGRIFWNYQKLKNDYIGKFKSGFIFTKNNIKIALNKYKKLKGGEQSDIKGGNNYNDLWYSRKIYNT